MLDNCKLVVCDSHDDLKREGIQSLTIAGNILQFKNPPCLEGQIEEKRGDEDNTNTKHTYWFILRTPSRDYVFACNSIRQRSQWMFFMNKAIQNANEIASSVLAC